MVCEYRTGTWTRGGDTACWSGLFSYLAAELVSVGRKLTEGRFISTICTRPNCANISKLRVHWLWQIHSCLYGQTQALSRVLFLINAKVGCLSWPPPSFVFLLDSFFSSSSPSLSPSSLSTSLAPSGSVTHNCVSWEIISSWPCFRSSDIFHLSSIFHPLPFFFITPSLPSIAIFLPIHKIIFISLPLQTN